MRLRHTAIAVTITALTLAACSSNDGSDQDEATAPDYKIVKQDTSGNQRLVTVEVDTTKNLRAVFDDVTDALTGDAGYFISINCSTGSNDNYEHRLANGKYAVGRTGAATTGLDEGDTEFAPVKGRSCPAKS